jgi:hypothetical protein
MRTGLILAAKLVLFVAVCVWILGLLAVGIAYFMPFSTTLDVFLAGAKMPILVFFQAWYWIAVVVLGLFCAKQGFSVIGRWVRK